MLKDIFEKRELEELQIAILHRVSELKKDLEGKKPGDAGYESRSKSLQRSINAKEKLMAK